MKRFLFAFAIMLFCVSANAQIMNPELACKGSRLFLDGEKLDRTDLKKLDGFDYATYLQGKKTANAGVVMMSSGGVTAALTVVAFCEGQPHDDIPGNGLAGMATITCGALTILLEAIGIPLYFSGKKKISTAVNQYRQAASPELSLSVVPCSDGFGLALHF